MEDNGSFVCPTCLWGWGPIVRVGWICKIINQSGCTHTHTHTLSHSLTHAHTHSLTSESSSRVSREIQSKNARHTRTVQTLHREISNTLEGHTLHYKTRVLTGWEATSWKLLMSSGAVRPSGTFLPRWKWKQDKLAWSTWNNPSNFYWSLDV